MSEADRIKAAYERRAAEGKSALYSPFRPDALLARQAVERALIAALKARRIDGLEGLRTLEIGCGDGRNLRRLLEYGAPASNLHGIDLRDEAITAAKAANPAIGFQSANAESLPFEDAAFDIVMQFTVFTSILSGDMKSNAAAEMLRVLKPGGLVIWFDFKFSNPRNRDVQGVGKGEIRALFPGCDIRLRRVILAPPLSRRIAPLSYTLAGWLGGIPWLCTHYLGTIRKPPAPGSP